MDQYLRGDGIFLSSSHLFGLSEQASLTELKTTMEDTTHYKEAYRLYNLYVFECGFDETIGVTWPCTSGD